MPAPEVVRQLVERFEEHKRAYLSPAYLEAQLRQEFLNPFFEALGWDVANKQGYAVQYREVVHEDSIHIKGSPNAKAPDYAFRLGGVRKFFVEAKKPAEDIENTREYAYQLKVYAWNLGLPLSILTDFEGFAVYDCRNKPKPTDSPATGRVMFIRYDEYIDRWDEIAGIFSPDAIRKGAFDQYAEDNTAKKGTIKVDDAFLQEIETWRTLLARNIALRNEQITNERQLNYAVQMTISRVIFLRICEDRGIEPQNQLLELSQGKEIYPQLVALYMKADQKYNSGLFHFRPEVGKPNSVDTFTPGLMIDDKVIKTIILSLYYPSPYVFKEIPVEILGQVYERFLGKVIRLTPARHAKIEEKPEVRKAGGVYYTPKYIVDYIVENTVGKLLEDKTPQEAAQLTIVDPACGSGSFLLGAYQYLLDWHESWYLGHDPEGWTRGKQPALVHTAEGDWRLTTEEKKRILLNNIYGVDIDAQAVEVTKLSLLLKVLEEETGQLSLGFERALPDLGDNIKCGNSLIGWDYFEGQLIRDEKEVERVNPFDWQRGFPAVFAKGGFDAVIGNPPYIRIQAMKEWAPGEAEFLKTIYESASKGNYDVYVVFVEKGLSLVNKDGILGYILPHKFFQAQFASPLRQLIAKGKHINKIVHFGAEQVFENATTYTCLLFLSKHRSPEFEFYKVEGSDKQEHLMKNIDKLQTNKDYKKAIISQPEDDGTEWHFFAGKSKFVLDKLNFQPYKLSDITRKIFVGLQTSADKIYVLKTLTTSEETITCYSRSLNCEVEIEKGLVKPFLMGKDVHRYEPPKPENVVIFPYLISSNKSELMSQHHLKNNYPLGWNYLLENRKDLSEREKGKMFGHNFYAYIYPKNLLEFEQQKIMTPDIAFNCQFTYDFDSTYHTTTIYSLALNPTLKLHQYFLLGILNSKVMWFFLMNTGNILRGGYFRFKTKYLEPFPIPIIDLNDSDNRKKHERMVTFVDHMLTLHKRTPQTPNDKQRLQREIDATDAQIDRLVYELYGLTEEEIKIVEGE
ncbi:MAG: N-6 DNA methylase [Anaerolineaceae bacterium]